jgi:hypothetical protein
MHGCTVRAFLSHDFCLPPNALVCLSVCLPACLGMHQPLRPSGVMRTLPFHMSLSGALLSFVCLSACLSVSVCLQGARGPVHAAFTEHSVVYSYYSAANARHEVSVVELYDASPRTFEAAQLAFGYLNETVSSYQPVPLEVGSGFRVQVLGFLGFKCEGYGQGDVRVASMDPVSIGINVSYWFHGDVRVTSMDPASLEVHFKNSLRPWVHPCSVMGPRVDPWNPKP